MDMVILLLMFLLLLINLKEYLNEAQMILDELIVLVTLQRFANVDESTIMQRIADIRNAKLRQDSADFVGGALEFRGSPQTVRAVNSDSNPYNDIEEIGTTGIIPDSIHRGGAGDNQFLVGSQDAKLSAPAPVNISAAPSSPSVASAPVVPSVPAAAMPSTNVAVIGAPDKRLK